MKEIVEQIASKYGVTKKLSREIVDDVFASLTDSVKTGSKVRISGVGTFSVKERAARTARNPKTGETVQVPAKKTVKFTPAKDLKESL